MTEENAEKLSKEDAGYRVKGEGIGNRCGVCKYYYRVEGGRCMEVDGPTPPGDICNHFKSFLSVMELGREAISKGWEMVMLAADLPQCPDCGEPYCTHHEKHYADCECIGPTEDGVEYRDISGLLVGKRVLG